MTHSRRVSQCVMIDAQLPTSVNPSVEDVEEWVKAWSGVFARGCVPMVFGIFLSILTMVSDLIDSRIVSVESETSVEEACDVSSFTTTYNQWDSSHHYFYSYF